MRFSETTVAANFTSTFQRPAMKIGTVVAHERKKSVTKGIPIPSHGATTAPLPISPTLTAWEKRCHKQNSTSFVYVVSEGVYYLFM